MTSDRQHVTKELASYGKAMHEVFRHMIALRRFELAGVDKLDREETAARAIIVRTVAKFKRFLQPDDWNRIQWFYAGLKEADMTTNDDQLIEDVLHRYGVSRLST